MFKTITGKKWHPKRFPPPPPPLVLRFSPVNFIPPVLHSLEKWNKLIIFLFIFITGLHNKPQGCGTSVASAAGPFSSTTKHHYSDNLTPVVTTDLTERYLPSIKVNNCLMYTSWHWAVGILSSNVTTHRLISMVRSFQRSSAWTVNWHFKNSSTKNISFCVDLIGLVLFCSCEKLTHVLWVKKKMPPLFTEPDGVLSWWNVAENVKIT
jgi:hypothetical protein